VQLSGKPRLTFSAGHKLWPDLRRFRGLQENITTSLAPTESAVREVKYIVTAALSGETF
jgi:hypothetical protein